MIGEFIGFCRPADIVDFKPDSRFHPLVADCFHRLFQPLRKQGRRYVIISHADIPRDSVLFEPAAVNDKIVKSLVFYAFQNPADIFMGWISPCRTVFIENDRQLLFAFRSVIDIFISGTYKAVTDVINPTFTHRKNCRRCFEMLPWFYRFFPVSKFTVCQSSAQMQSIVLSVDFHLPGCLVRQLNAPGYPCRLIFDRHKRKIFHYRHRAPLSKTFYGNRPGRPAWLELHILDVLRHKPSLVTPFTEKPVYQ